MIGVMMMVMSMTGYGQDTLSIDDVAITVEIRSVNSRYLDIITKLPRNLLALELDIKKVIQRYVHRGRIDVYISITGGALEERSLSVDWHLLDQYMEQLDLIQVKYGLSDDIPISAITEIDELFHISERSDQNGDIHNKILTTVENAIKQVMASRKSEGEFLQNDIEKRLVAVDEAVEKIDQNKKPLYEKYYERIKQRIESHLGQENTIDEAQLMKEIAILAEKSDITEEIVRLKSHITHFEQALNQAGPVGRKLDFIVQELNREINTIGAKSIDPTISEWVVHIKSDLEKMKEQIQNIE